MVQSALDKRRFFRHPINVPIEFQERQNRGSRTSTVDISEGGLCFLSEKFLPKGAALHLKIPVGEQVFSIQVEVAYANRVATLERFRIGVVFKDATSAFRAKLAEEMLQVKLYQKKISEELGKEISEEEAAKMWIEKYAKRFAGLF